LVFLLVAGRAGPENEKSPLWRAPEGALSETIRRVLLDHPVPSRARAAADDSASVDDEVRMQARKRMRGVSM
jgi:hypothetical protein